MSVIVFFVRAINNWRGRGGNLFRRTLKKISMFAGAHQLRTDDLATLASIKLQGIAHTEIAQVVKTLNEAEQIAVDTQLAKRLSETRVRKEELEVREKELTVLGAELELFRKLNEIGVVLRVDSGGSYTILPKPMGMDLTAISALGSEPTKSATESSPEPPDSTRQDSPS
jgi:hypothetical protein